MKWLLAIICPLLVLGVGCRREPVPAETVLYQTVGDFHYDIPEGWVTEKVIGIDAVVLRTQDDQGLQPNVFVEEVRTGVTPREALIELARRYASAHPDLVAAVGAKVVTPTGVTGEKMSSTHANTAGLQVAQFHYSLDLGDRVVLITCGCAATTKAAYEAVFDAIIGSILPGPPPEQ